MSRRDAPVMGHVLPAPRITRAGILLLVLHLGLPLLGLLAAMDVLVWAIGRAAFHTCIGVWCWL